MNLRVTAQIQTANAIANIEQQTSAIARFQNQISSGTRINFPSDDPAAYPALVFAKANSARYATYTQTISDSTSVLNAGVSALGQINDILTQAKQIATQGANATTEDPGYNALATQTDGLIGQALQAANAQVDGRAIFGGTAAGNTPFAIGTTNAQNQTETVVYNGTDQRSRVLIDQNQTVDTRYVGSQVFQQPGSDVFQALISLRDTLQDNSLSGPAKSAALNQRLTDVDNALTAIGNVTAEQSSNLATLDALQNQISDLKLASDARIGDIGGTDYADAIVKMNEQQNSLQATLAVSAQLFQGSLLNFINFANG